MWTSTVWFTDILIRTHIGALCYAERWEHVLLGLFNLTAMLCLLIFYFVDVGLDC